MRFKERKKEKYKITRRYVVKYEETDNGVEEL